MLQNTYDSITEFLRQAAGWMRDVTVKIERNGPPALDADCGTGRLSFPFLRAGLDVDGSDVSPDLSPLD
jgi:2-polyprenyl-3-methyl-5-hydroxy-6-metoxy-1,4-benzoquinol methylase